MNVVVIRHGMIAPPQDFAGNDLMYPPEIKLNEEGISQAKKLAEELLSRGLNLPRIYTSTFSRALEYAKLVASKMRISEVIVDNELRDPDISVWIGRTAGEIEGTDSYTLRNPGDETYEEVIIRMEKTFRRLQEKNRGELFGVVSHGDPIQVLMRRLEFPDEGLNNFPRIDILRLDDYLKRGDAWVLELDSIGKLIKKEHIGEGFQFSNPERR